MNELTLTQTILLAIFYTMGCGISWGLSAYIFHSYIKLNWHQSNWMDYRALSFFCMWLSWFSVSVGLCGIIARHLAENNNKRKRNLSLRKRLFRLLRINFTLFLETVLSLGLVALMVLLYAINL